MVYDCAYRLYWYTRNPSMYFNLTTARHNQAQDYEQGSGYDATLVHCIAVAARPRALLLKLFTPAICLLELLQRFMRGWIWRPNLELCLVSCRTVCARWPPQTCWLLCTNPTGKRPERLRPRADGHTNYCT